MEDEQYIKDRVEIINRISKLRFRAKLSARSLSQEIGMNDGYINRLECKKDFLPSMEVLLRIIKVCKSTPEEFFHRDFDNYKKDMEILDLLSQVKEGERKDVIIKMINWLGEIKK